MNNTNHLDGPPLPIRAKINQFEAPPRPYRNITRNDRMLAPTPKTHSTPTISQRAEMFKTSTVTFFRKNYNKLLKDNSRLEDYPLPKAPLADQLSSHENRMPEQRNRRITMNVFKLFSNINSTQNNNSNNSNINNNSSRNSYQVIQTQRLNRAVNYEQYSHYPWFKEFNRWESEIYLREKPSGTFMFRPTLTSDAECTMSIAYNGYVFHFLIYKRENGHYAMGQSQPDEPTFMNLYDLVNHYRRRPLSLSRNGVWLGAQHLLVDRFLED